MFTGEPEKLYAAQRVYCTRSNIKCPDRRGSIGRASLASRRWVPVKDG